MYLLLFVLWLVLNGKVTLEICLFGLAITAALGLLCFVLFRYTPRKELRLYTKVPLFLAYIAVLLREILKANFTMLAIIFNKKRTVEPALVTFDADLKTEFARYMLANSITLTPGTITVATDGRKFTVHCLDEKMLDGAESSIFVRLLQKLEA